MIKRLYLKRYKKVALNSQLISNATILTYNRMFSVNR